jgi:hypothetical protein
VPRGSGTLDATPTHVGTHDSVRRCRAYLSTEEVAERHRGVAQTGSFSTKFQRLYTYVRRQVQAAGAGILHHWGRAIASVFSASSTECAKVGIEHGSSSEVLKRATQAIYLPIDNIQHESDSRSVPAVRD